MTIQKSGSEFQERHLRGGGSQEKNLKRGISKEESVEGDYAPHHYQQNKTGKYQS